MERRPPVTAATGALGPVLTKLTTLLGDQQYKLALEPCRSDVEFIKSNLESVRSLLLSIWEREDVDVACKDWMAEARRLSYSMEEDIDGIVLGLERGDDSSGAGFVQREEASTSPFDGLKEQVQCLLKGCSEEWKALGTISNLTAATGALGPVLANLTSLLDNDEYYQLEEATRSDIESVKSDLELVCSLLQSICGRGEDLDAASEEWMAEARDLSDIMEDDIDEIILDFKSRDRLFKELKSRCQLFDEWSIHKTISDIIAAKGSAESTEPVSEYVTRLGSLSEYGCIQHGNKRDIELIKSKLETMYYVVRELSMPPDPGSTQQHLELGYEDLSRMAHQAKDLLSSIGDGIDKIILDLRQQISKMRPFQGLTNEVRGLVDRSYKLKAATRAVEPSPASQQLLGHLSDSRKPREDPRSGLHKDVAELVEMDEKKDEFIRLLEEHQTICIVGFAGMGKTTLADLVYDAIGTKFRCQAFVSVSPRPNMMRILTSILRQVMVSAITEAAAGMRKAVTDSAQVAGTVVTDSDKQFLFMTSLLEVLGADKKENQKVEAEKNLIRNISDFLQREVTGNTQGTGAEVKQDLIKVISKFLAYKRSQLDCIKKYNDYLIKIISKFLGDKRYLIIVDDIWNWKHWEVIRNALPKNNLGSRIITTTRVNAIAEKCCINNNAFAYEIAGLSPDATLDLSERILKDSWKVYNIPRDVDGPCASISRMTRGMPLAAICMSSAVAEQLSAEDGKDLDLKQFHLAESRALEGFLNIPCLRPLVASFSHGYHELPLHLKTCLLHCCIYPPYHILERDELTRIWIAEGFVHDEAEAQSCIDELLGMGFIWRCSTMTTAPSLQYEMNVMMLHFLRCKSHDDYFVASQDCGSDISSMQAIQIRRLCFHSYQYNFDISRLHVPSTRFLYFFDYTWISSLKQFERLRLLHLYCDYLRNAHLVDICGLLELRCLSLRVSLVNLLPKQIGRLQHLKTLNVTNTGILGLPREIGQLEHLETLDVSNTMVIELPREIGRLQQLKTLDARNSCIRELPKEIGELKHLETLDVSNTMVVELPREIGGLLHLKTLDARGTNVREVCKEIGELHQLETLDLRSTMVTELPKEIEKLLRLKMLVISDTLVTELPKEIGELQHLETLDVSGTMVKELPSEIGKLQHLKTLNISNTVVRELPWEVGRRSNSVHVFVGDNGPPKVVTLLERVCGASEDDNHTSLENCGEKLSITLFNRFGLSWEPLPFARLKVAERHMGVPMLIKNHLKDISSLEISVWKLEEEDFKFLRDMPNLQALALQLELRPRGRITITSTGFSKLESFCVDCRAPRVTFKEGAMPRLKHLEFKFYACRPTQNPMGIKHLLSLRSVVFRCGSARYKSDAPGISEIIGKVRKEAQEHPDRITFHINDTKEVYPEKGIKLSEENGTIIDGAVNSSARGEAALISNDIDDEGNIIPVSSYYPFGLVE